MNNILRSSLSTLNVEEPVFAYTDYGNYFYSVYLNIIQSIRKYQFSDYTHLWITGIALGFSVLQLYTDGTYLWAVVYNSSTGVQLLLKIDNTTGSILGTTSLGTYTIYNPSFTMNKVQQAGIAFDGTNLWVIITGTSDTSGTTLYRINQSSGAVINTYTPTDQFKSSLYFSNSALWYISIGQLPENGSSGFTDSFWDGLIKITDLSNDPPTYTNIETGIWDTSFPATDGDYYFLSSDNLFFDGTYVYLSGEKCRLHQITGTSTKDLYPQYNILVKYNATLLSKTYTSFPAPTGQFITDSNIWFNWVTYNATLNNFFIKNNVYSAIYRISNTGIQTLNGTYYSDKTPEMEIWPLIDSGNIFFVKVIDSTHYDTIRASNSLRDTLRTEPALTITQIPQVTTEELTQTDSSITPEKSSCHDFSFAAEAGKSYLFTVDNSIVTGAEWDDTLSPGTLPFISILDSNENELLISGTYSAAEAKSLRWTAPSTDTYHVRIRTQE